MQDEEWDGLRFVLAVARHRSFAAAAGALGVNESTVARRMARAESRLGAKLFDRAAGYFAPTAAGEEVVRRAERIEAEVQAAREAVGGTDLAVAGRVRITAVPLVANRILAPALPGLQARHPQLEVELIAEPADLSLLRGEADIALRLARPHGEGSVLARRLGEIRYAIFAARGAEPAALPWIGYVESMTSLPQNRWIAAQPGARQDGAAALRVNDAESLLQLVRAGAGKSFLPAFVADMEPGLIRLDDGAGGASGGPGWSREIWMMLHPRVRTLARMRVAADWLAALLAERCQEGRPAEA